METINQLQNIPSNGTMEMAGHTHPMQSKAILQMQLHSLVNNVRILEQRFFNLRHRYQKLPVEMRDNEALVSDQCRALCVVEFGGNNPLAVFPQMMFSLDETVRITQRAINERLFDGAMYGLNLAARTIRDAEGLVQALTESLAAYEKTTRTVELGKRLRHFLQALREFGIFRKQLQDR